ncbi:class I SAM-dependent RNA methyltransferase [Actinomyces bowdenii]|uniref:class I SAM-dependent RNA methyltransferase n=1 Tax=Actinomyces bowdenii TaxID=131109 RepID=UPI001ABD199B|nr:TRAM domain-containing protein [Actinomyces bowdenii]MBO3725207.1 class I SAM-dependent RNA methyltransferase [Actinomyces bowdenii]
MTSQPPPETRAPSGAEEMTLSVGPPAHGGHCVARPAQDPAGRVVFVRHALPGETVRARMTERSAKIWRADAVEVLQASPDRVASVWPQAGPGGVGGGELAHVALPAQRTWKRWVLADCLRRIGGQEVHAAVAGLPEAAGSGSIAVEPMPSEADGAAHAQERRRAPGTATRTRVSLSVGPDGRAGMHAFRSGTVLPLDRLPLAVPAIQGIGLLERSRWRKHYRPGARIEAIAPSAGEPLVLIDGQVLTASARSTGRRRVEEVVEAGALGLGPLRYSVHAEGFWQVHHQAPEVLVERVVRAALGARPGPDPSGPAPDLAEAGSGRRVLELYSGSGLLTLPLAMLVGSSGLVLSQEASGRAVGDARRNLHGWSRAHLATGRVTPRSVGRAATAFEGRGPDVVVLDPPRQGAGREVCRAIAALAPERIVLVACDPAALSRDLAVLLGSGYRLAAMSALDMFPHTHHFETISVLERG